MASANPIQQAAALRGAAGITARYFGTRLSTASRLSAASRFGTASGLASRLAARITAGALGGAVRSQPGQQPDARLAARLAASRLTGGLSTTGGLDATSGLAGRLAAGTLGSAVGSQTSQQADARRAARIAADGFSTAGRFRFATAARIIEETSLSMRRTEQTHQADHQQGGENHAILHWEGSSNQFRN
ncbi:MAG: hypothetical protein MUF48_16995 [Pirellulaceae bacterium]|nr:hypothetical protein [Pirellulaceae bacterium]